MKNFKKFIREYKMSFTLAEVVVVMAILSIMMVAFAPVVTKKTSSTSDTFRTFIRTSGNHGIYYGGDDDTKPVIIGDNKLASSYTSVPTARLYIKKHEMAFSNSSYLMPDIAFMTMYDASGDKNNLSGQLIVAGENPVTTQGSFLFKYHNLFETPAFAEDGTGNSLASIGIAEQVSIILTDANRKFEGDIGKKEMTIIGGKACLGADAGIEGLVCIGSNAGSDSYSNYDIYIGDKSRDLHAGRIFFGGKSLITHICQTIRGAVTDNAFSADGLCHGIAAYSSLTGSAGTHSLNPAAGEHIQLAFDVTADNTLIPSDERLKNVGKPFTAGLDAINKINPVNFTYKRDKDKFPHVGVIAQSLAPVFPNAISVNKDGYFYIRTEDMFYAAINAIKELYQMYLAHDKKVQQLEERSAVLEQQNKELQVLYIELAKRVEKLDKKQSRNITFTPMPVFEEEIKNETSEPTVEEETVEEESVK